MSMQCSYACVYFSESFSLLLLYFIPQSYEDLQCAIFSQTIIKHLFQKESEVILQKHRPGVAL